MRRTFLVSQLLRRGAGPLALSLVVIAGTVAGEQIKQPPRASAARQRFLEMFARGYFPGRTGQLLIVPREGDFITRSDPNAAYMHGSPWPYDVSIPLMFVGPAVNAGVFSIPAALPTLTALRRQSAWFTQAQVNFLPTNTAVGHSTISTAPIPACTASPASACTTARMAGATTCSPEDSRAI